MSPTLISLTPFMSGASANMLDTFDLSRPSSSLGHHHGNTGSSIGGSGLPSLQLPSASASSPMINSTPSLTGLSPAVHGVSGVSSLIGNRILSVCSHRLSLFFLLNFQNFPCWVRARLILVPLHLSNPATSPVLLAALTVVP
jgi:hypothetical protein